MKKRTQQYAEDEDYRKRCKGQNRAYHAVHRENDDERQRCRSWAKKLSDFCRRLSPQEAAN